LFHRLRRGDQVIALVETGIVAYDYQAHSVTALPEVFLQALNGYLNQ
jgi:acyl-CoA thioesterase FadM